MAGIPRVSANRDSPRNTVAAMGWRDGLPTAPLGCAAARSAIGSLHQYLSLSVYTDSSAPSETRRVSRRPAPRRYAILAKGHTMPAAHDRSTDQARADIAAALGQIGFALPGSIAIRCSRCGKPRCACKADPPSLHGPYIQWTRTVKGKTVTRLLTPAQYGTYAAWFANARRLRALAAELEALSLKEMARAEGWAKITPGTPAPPRTRPARAPNPNYPKPPKTPGDEPA